MADIIIEGSKTHIVELTGALRFKGGRLQQQFQQRTQADEGIFVTYRWRDVPTVEDE